LLALGSAACTGAADDGSTLATDAASDAATGRVVDLDVASSGAKDLGAARVDAARSDPDLEQQALDTQEAPADAQAPDDSGADAVAQAGEADLGSAIDADDWVAGQTDITDIEPSNDATDVSASEDALPDVLSGADAAPAWPDGIADVNVVLVAPPFVNAGYLTIVALPPSAAKALDATTPDGIVLWSGEVPTIPSWHAVDVPPGEWGLGAILWSAPGGQVHAHGVACIAGQITTIVGSALATTGATPDASIFITPPNCVWGGPCIDADVVIAKGPAAPLFFDVEESLSPPEAGKGDNEFLGAHKVGDRLWVAGGKDGFVSFEFPSSPGAGEGPYQGWKLWGGKQCFHIDASGDDILCSTRLDTLRALPFKAAKPAVSIVAELGADHTEGLVRRGDLAYVAAHAKGLVAVSSQAPHTPVALDASLGLTDAWNVLTFGPDHLVVADGAKGIVVLDVSGTNATAPQKTGALTLPGVSTSLAVDGTLLAVGALSGGTHVVDLSTPEVPKLVGTLALADPSYGVAWDQGVLIVAAGHHIVAADPISEPGSTTIRARAAATSPRYALGVHAAAGDLFLSESRLLRRMHTVPEAGKGGPVLLTRPIVYAPKTLIGESIPSTLYLHNAGNAPLVVSHIDYREKGPIGGVTLTLQGPWTAAPGAQVVIPVSVPKVGAPTPEHTLEVVSNDPQSPVTSIHLSEVYAAAPGELFPTLTYADKAGKLHAVKAELAGKPAVILLAAFSGALGLETMAIASTELAPKVAAGTIGAMILDPWDKPTDIEVTGIDEPLAVLYTPLTTKDNHGWSDLLDDLLAQQGSPGPAMPIVYVIDASGKIVMAEWGWSTPHVEAALKAALSTN